MALTKAIYALPDLGLQRCFKILWRREILLDQTLRINIFPLTDCRRFICPWMTPLLQDCGGTQKKLAWLQGMLGTGVVVTTGAGTWTRQHTSESTRHGWKWRNGERLKFGNERLKRSMFTLGDEPDASSFNISMSLYCYKWIKDVTDIVIINMNMNWWYLLFNTQNCHNLWSDAAQVERKWVHFSVSAFK